ncbi:ATPase, F1/V1/A1 complex, alpha/beta subunit, Zinc knuckle CX2CX4HX4C [Artemisia annua]|uniref:ATPase, F1/V1/A1 complex, alpha/beta subunit, Zinc knuckle CX2CX4HX4C n=1 Tax=Artemisia annua TaxID=35608 RepID=A0A2U1MYA4_ARTAN|nr:ATPase, F1/V1/A1 complex, alpha/beta subunit, Zinc knuckle CX2CX4HX4C [Artemisia annua]
MRHNDESFVEHDQGTPAIDTLNSKVLESIVTNERTNSGAKVVIPITVVDDMVKKISNMLYSYFVNQRLAFPLVEDYVKHAWAKFGFQRFILRVPILISRWFA